MNKYSNLIFSWLFLVLLVPGVLACKNKKAQPAPEEAKITAILLNFLTEQKGKQNVSVQFKDPAGINGKQATSPLRLQANTTYTSKITLLNESKTPAADISITYNVSFLVTGLTNVTINKQDRQFEFKTGAASTNADGLLRIEMKQNTNVQQVTFPFFVSQ